MDLSTDVQNIGAFSNLFCVSKHIGNEHHKHRIYNDFATCGRPLADVAEGREGCYAFIHCNLNVIMNCTARRDKYIDVVLQNQGGADNYYCIFGVNC